MDTASRRNETMWPNETEHGSLISEINEAKIKSIELHFVKQAGS